MDLPKGWAQAPLNLLLAYEQPQKYIVSSTDYNDSYQTPVLTAGKSFVIGYTNETEGIYSENLPVIIFDDFTTATQFVTFPFKVKSSAMKMLNITYHHLNIKCLFYRMQTIRHNTTTHKRYWISDYSKAIIELPPLAEQDRIVAKVDALFSKLDKGVETLHTLRQQLKTYRQAVLKQAFNEKDWELATIEQFLTQDRRPMATGPFGTMLKKHEHQQSGVPVLGIENIGAGKFKPNNKIFVTAEKAEDLKSFMLRSDDIIISRSGTVGELCIVPAHMEGSLLSTNLMRVTLDDEKILPKYFVYLFQSKGVVIDQVKELCKGSTRDFLNQNILKKIKFPLPSISIQTQVVAEVESRLSLCDKLEDIVSENLEKSQALRQSILKKAFEGKLVPQDPNDEPAEILLERIKAEIATVAPPKSARRKKNG